MSNRIEKQTMPTARNWSKTSEPKDFTDIYRYIQDELSICSKIIDQMEEEYYQVTPESLSARSTNFSSKRPLSVNALSTWSRLLNELINSGAARSISNAKSIRELLILSKNGALFGNISEDHISLMHRILDKTTDQLHLRMPNLADRINDSMRIMERYFLSFYEIENIQDYLQNKKKEKKPVGLII